MVELLSSKFKALSSNPNTTTKKKKKKKTIIHQSIWGWVELWSRPSLLTESGKAIEKVTCS
jgi:hypothetical protein